MAKEGWKEGVGSYSKSYPKVTDMGSRDSKVDRSSEVNEVGNRNGGYSAPVSKSRNHP